jgi:hypothetical protein
MPPKAYNLRFVAYMGVWGSGSQHFMATGVRPDLSQEAATGRRGTYQARASAHARTYPWKRSFSCHHKGEVNPPTETERG